MTAHCFGEESLRDLAAAGIDCIEHATGLQEDSIDTFAAQGIAIVPTLVNIAQFPALAAPAAEKFPGYHRHMLDLHERRHATVGAAHEAGVPIYVGTDAGGSLPHGLVGAEMVELTKAGLSQPRGHLGCDVGRARVARPSRARRGRRRRPRRAAVRPAR